MSTPLGDKIKELRKRKGYSLDVLAERSEVSKSYLWELENRDTANPTVDKLGKIADVLGVTSEFLFGSAQKNLAETSADRAFFRKYEKLPEPTKRKIQEILKVIQDSDNQEK